MTIVNWEEFLLPYEQVVDALCLKFRGIQREFQVFSQHSPIEQVEGRVKQVGSILDKANRKGIPPERIASEVDDIAGVRVICRFVEDIDHVIEILRAQSGQSFQIIRERDYITNTKPSGYRSYHIHIRYPLVMLSGPRDVVAEIQIRTLAMNFWATIEHSLKYKYNGNIPADLQKRLISSAEAAFILDKEMSTIREDIMQVQKVIQTKNDLADQILNKGNAD